MEIAVLTSSRADYGFYKPLLKFKDKGNINFNLIVFGTHLSEKHGYTISTIIEDEIDISMQVHTQVDGDAPAEISRSIGEIHKQFSEVWRNNSYDFILCLGDRFEMYAAVSASVPFNIPIIHLSGGEETSGAIDNYFRHALTLMSKIHFTNTKLNAKRVAEIKGSSKNIYHTGSLAIDNIISTELFTPEEFKAKFNFNLKDQFILFTFHPETLNFELNSIFAKELESFIINSKYSILATMPNTDTNGSVIRDMLLKVNESCSHFFIYKSLGSKGYYSALKYAYCVLGNSSSGIVEAASFGKYAINLGDRQKGRERGENIIDCPISELEINLKLEELKSLSKLDVNNIYGDGKTAGKMIEILRTLN